MTTTDSTGGNGTTTVVLGLESALVAAAASRYDQLRSLPEVDGDPLVAAQRDALAQTITDIAAARRRIEAGTYGACTRCDRPIPAERLELRPWADTCVGCATASQESAR